MVVSTVSKFLYFLNYDWSNLSSKFIFKILPMFMCSPKWGFMWISFQGSPCSVQQTNMMQAVAGRALLNHCVELKSRKSLIHRTECEGSKLGQKHPIHILAMCSMMAQVRIVHGIASTRQLSVLCQRTSSRKKDMESF